MLDTDMNRVYLGKEYMNIGNEYIDSAIAKKEELDSLINKIKNKSITK